MYYLAEFNQAAGHGRIYRFVHDAPKSYDRYVALDVQPIIHVKTHPVSDDKRWVPCAMIGLRPDRCLVRTVDAAGRLTDAYHEVWLHDVREAWHLTRKVVKVMKLFSRLAREVQRKRASAERLAQREAERADKVGCCPVCFGDFVVRQPKKGRPKVVLHGYRRPGWGHTVGSCFGVDYPPLEVSLEGLTAHQQRMVGWEANIRANLATLGTLTEITRAPRWPGEKAKTYKLGEKGFEDVRDARRHELVRQLRDLHAEMEICEAKAASWTPQPWPRAPKGG